MMGRRKMNGHVMRHASKTVIAAMTTFALVFQPCLMLTAQAEVLYDKYDYDNSYSEYDYSGYSGGRRLLSSTQTYDDGTKATTQYRYDELGNTTYINTTEPDGSKYTVERTYNGNTLLKETIHEYNAEYDYGVTRTSESGSTGIHVITKTEYGSGDYSSKEEWYDIRGNGIKTIYNDSTGVSYQSDSVYNERDNLVETMTTYSDGSFSRRECWYNENGKLVRDRTHEYDAVAKEEEYVESAYEWNGESLFVYSIEKEINQSREVTTETKRSADAGKSVKITYAYTNGSQITEKYIYDSEGNEIYYSGASSDGTTWKRETTITDDSEKTVEIDKAGNTITTTYNYDMQTGRDEKEVSSKNADGSTSYIKYVYADGYTLESSVSRHVSAEGIETYEESKLESDGTYTYKTKTEDGIISVIKKDSEGNELERNETLPDGTKSQVIWEKRYDGQPISQVKLYSDGSIDRIDYAYDEDGNNIQQTETRRNGVGAVTVLTYTGADKTDAVERTTFNNGCQIETVLDVHDDASYQVTITYSGGDIAQQIFMETSYKSCNLKTVYRDGRVEEEATDSDSEDWYERCYALKQKYSAYYYAFLEQAWNILPGQVAAGSDSQ